MIYDKKDGFWAARLWWTLRAIGIDAKVLDGGFRAWQESGQLVEGGDVAPASPGHLIAQEQPDMWTRKEQVLAVVNGCTTATLVCALSPEVFRGDTPTRYTRRGHIPGSLNLPARDFFDGASHRFKSLPELAEVAERTLEGSPRPIILYCGGGFRSALAADNLQKMGYTNAISLDGGWHALKESGLPLTEPRP